MSRLFDRIRGCPACAIIVWAAIMSLIYCALAWWALSGPVPKVDARGRTAGAPFCNE